MAVILVGGGSRSGKSRFALDVARECGPKRVFIATAEAGDEEMAERIAHHRTSRGQSFTTIEEPLDLAPHLSIDADAIVVDCLTLWLSNLLHAGRDPAAEGPRLLAAATAAGSTVILVTNEVGCGIVPIDALSRQFRDAAGRLNQQAAACACAVYYLTFGISQRIK